MRVGVAGVHHETNTFAGIRADLAAFDRAGVVRGPEIVDRHRDTATTVAGFLRTCAESGVDLRPLVYAYLTPCGVITSEAFEQLSGEIMHCLQSQGPLDVVLLAQHGAAVSERHRDADAELVARVRECVGRDVVIAVALDLHANLTERLVDMADIVVGYREHPHRDAVHTGAECARIALTCARAKAKVTQHLIRLPMVVPVLGGQTDEAPMRAVMAGAAEVAARHSLLSYSLFQGFGYADVAAMGSSAVAMTIGDAATARAAAMEIATLLWDVREELRKPLLDPHAALAEADRLARSGAPAMVMDVGDNVGAGAPGDSTILLDAAIAQSVRGVVAPVCDARAATAAADAGLGAEIELTVGARTAVSTGQPVRVRGRVRTITDGRFDGGVGTHAGLRFYDSGLTVRISTAHGGEVLVCSRPTQTTSPEQLRALAIEPRDVGVIIAKGVIAPRAGYEGLVSAFVLADTPGVTAAEPPADRYRHRQRPLWPFERSGALDSCAGASADVP